MTGRFVLVVLTVLLVVFQAQLWLGRGSVLKVHQMRHKLDEQLVQNTQAKIHNDQLAAEVHDLKEGLEMVEERARTELGMLKPNEIFVQIAKGK